jgi:hypothetical protein
MTINDRRRFLLTAGIMVAALTIAGCTGGGSGSGDTTTGGETGGSSTGGSGSGGSGGGDDEIDPLTCVLGGWRISQEQMQLWYDQFFDDDDVTFTVRGDTDVIFGDTDYEYFPASVFDFDVAGVPGSVTLFGSIAGDYVVDGGIITTNNEINTITSTVEVEGFTMDGSDLANDLLSASPVTSAPYECRSGPELIISMETGSGRVPVLLEPVR